MPVFSISSFKSAGVYKGERMKKADTKDIKETVTAIAKLSDMKQWEKLPSYFVDKPYVDEQALTKQMPGITSVKNLINNWRRELTAYFYGTRRHIKKMAIKIDSASQARAVSDTSILYFIVDQGQRYVWTVAGTYTYKLVKRAGQWKVSQIHFDLKDQFLKPLNA
jgi:hypothetical protein